MSPGGRKEQLELMAMAMAAMSSGSNVATETGPDSKGRKMGKVRLTLENSMERSERVREDRSDGEKMRTTVNRCEDDGVEGDSVEET